MGRTFQTHLRVCILRLSLSVLSSLAFAVASGGGEPTPYDPLSTMQHLQQQQLLGPHPVRINTFNRLGKYLTAT